MSYAVQSHFVFKATLCNFEPHKLLQKTKAGHILRRKCPLLFPSDVLQLLCLSAAFYLAGLSPTTTCCSFSLQAADMLLSGTSMNHRAEAEQSEDITGKTRGHFLFKIWPDFTIIAVLCDVLTCIFKSQSKLHGVALICCCIYWKLQMDTTVSLMSKMERRGDRQENEKKCKRGNWEPDQCQCKKQATGRRLFWSCLIIHTPNSTRT